MLNYFRLDPYIYIFMLILQLYRIFLDLINILQLSLVILIKLIMMLKHLDYLISKGSLQQFLMLLDQLLLLMNYLIYHIIQINKVLIKEHFCHQKLVNIEKPKHYFQYIIYINLLIYQHAWLIRLLFILLNHYQNIG